MKRLTIAILLIVSAFAFTSCKQDMTDTRLIGTWVEESNAYTATFTDTTLTISFSNPMLGTLNYEWTAKDGVLTLKMGNSTGTKTYSINGDTLVMGGDTLHKT